MNLDSRPINYLHSLKIQEHSCIFNNRQKCIKWIESYSWRRKKKRIHFYREIFHYISRKLIISQRYSVSSALYNVHAYHNIYMIPHCQTEQKTRERRKAKIQYNIILPQVPSQVIFIINKLECNFFLCFAFFSCRCPRCHKKLCNHNGKFLFLFTIWEYQLAKLFGQLGFDFVDDFFFVFW